MVSAEDQERADERIPLLLDTPLAVRGVSYEPALWPIDFEGLLTGETPNGLDWIIVGGESGPKARPFDLAWARSVVEQCRAAGVACFVKQLGARPVCDLYRDASGAVYPTGDFQPVRLKHPHGGDITEWPADLRVRQFPAALGVPEAEQEG